MSVVNNTTDASDVLSQYRVQQDQTKSGSELMIAQLKNQNPLEPQDNGEFISQLAQFSSLEEMQSLSGSVDDMASQFRSTQALQASAMVGRTVLAPSSIGVLGADGEISGNVSVPATTSGLRITIENESGEQIRQIDMGEQQPGQTAFSWDGKDGNGNSLPPGRYKVVAEASYPGGLEQLGTMVSANVDSVSLGQGGSITLNLAGMGSIALQDVQQIN